MIVKVSLLNQQNQHQEVGVVVYACNPSTQAGGLQAPGQPRPGETQSQKKIDIP
jgi:hypothetical protein